MMKIIICRRDFKEEQNGDEIGFQSLLNDLGYPPKEWDDINVVELDVEDFQKGNALIRAVKRLFFSSVES